MARVSLLTTGFLRAPWGHPILQGFADRTDPVFAAADLIQGHINTIDARVGAEAPYSSFFRPHEHAAYADTLSLWSNLEAMFAFAYHGLHAEAFRKRREWFVPMECPNHAVWWVADDHTPTWKEGYELHWQLSQNGSSPHVFHLRECFNASGEPYKIDRDEVHRIVSEHPILGKQSVLG